jgi:ribose 5-phosphate isomerase B
MNILCLGSEVIGPSLARDLVMTFVAARFDGGDRYVKRLQMIEDLERNTSHA